MRVRFHTDALSFLALAWSDLVIGYAQKSTTDGSVEPTMRVGGGPKTAEAEPVVHD